MKVSRLSEPLSAKASKFGGDPFCPQYTDWPCSRIDDPAVFNTTAAKRPMAFIGQFNFAEIISSVPELKGIIPDKGLLQLFYDLEEYPWGTYPKDFNHVSIVWYPDIEELDHFPAPSPISSYPETEYKIDFVYRPSLPEFGLMPESVEIPEEESDDYDELANYQVHHQVAGYPLSIQNDVLENIEIEMPSEDPTPWQVLLQIDSDNDMNIMWGDTGTLYLCVKAENLATADLSKTILQLQCF